MEEWIIACNPNKYDVIGAFNALDKIDWKQSTNIEVDDIVYIYIAKPVGAIRFKCVVQKVDMEYPEIDDIDYVIDDTGYADYGRYMQLQLLEKYNTPKLSYYQLHVNGLKTVQGPSIVPKQLSDYIFASTETLTGQRITRRHAVEILARAYDRPVTARNFTNIIYEIGKHQSAIFGELNFLAKSGEMKKEGTSAQYYFSPAVEQPTPQYYYVFQGRSFDEEYKEGFLWAPRNGNNGLAKHHWSRMGEVKKGDVILHGKQGRFIAVSVVKKDSYVSRRPNTDLSEKWADDGWCIETDYFVFPHAVRIEEYWDRIREIQPAQYAPFNKNGDGNQGYLFAANQELARFLLDATAGMIDFDEHISVVESAAETTKFSATDSDDEMESLLEERPQVQIQNHIAQFMKRLPEFRVQENELEVLRQRFVSDYTMQKIIGMTKDEYVVGFDRDDTFCYRIETELKNLGNIKGSNATKFGLYYGKSGDDTEKRYRASKKFSEDPDEALEKIKEQIVNLRMAGEKEDYDAIRACTLAPLFRGKLLSTFYPDKYLSIFMDEHLDYFMAKLGIGYSATNDILDKQQKLVTWKQSRDEFKGLSNYLFQRFLYSTYGRPFEDIMEEKDQQAIRDKEYPQDYVTKVNITIEQWKQIIRDPEIFQEKDLDLVKRIYMCDNHATACYDLGIQDGISPTSYIKPVVALARRVEVALGLDPIYRKNGKQVWWRILFWGRYREDTHFEWKLQPKLAKALATVFPELEISEVNDDEDKRLVEELKQASLSNGQDDFEYEDGFKEKPAAIYMNGHRTYPRDRQTAVNALAHAHYMCEIDAEHPTFVRRNSDKNYTEPHHLIPMSFSDQFPVSLDREQNIVSLCSNCHNLIHYGRDAGKFLKMLYQNRKEALQSVGINITYGQLLSMYQLKPGDTGDEKN